MKQLLQEKPTSACKKKGTSLATATLDFPSKGKNSEQPPGTCTLSNGNTKHVEMNF